MAKKERHPITVYANDEIEIIVNCPWVHGAFILRYRDAAKGKREFQLPFNEGYLKELLEWKDQWDK